MYKSLIIVYSDSIKNRYYNSFELNIEVILLVFRKIKFLYYISNNIKYTKGNIYIY